MAGTGGVGVNELERGIAEVDVLALQEVVHRGLIFSFAFVDDKQVGGYFFDVGQIVRRDKCQRLRAVAVEQAEHPVGRKHIEAVERLV